MDKEPFKPGLPVSFEINQRGGETFRSFIVGWDKDLYLLLRYPQALRGNSVTTGDKCLLRFLKGDNAFGFSSPILAFQFNPGPMLFLKYPDNVETVAFRQCKRYKTSLAAKLISQDRRSMVPVVMEDFSEHGCLLHVAGQESKVTEVGETCYITLQVLGMSMENIESIVRNRHVREGKQFIGVQFARKSESEKQMLSKLMDFMQKVRPDS